MEVNRADYEALLRVPGIGVTSARRILVARRCASLTFAGLKKLGVVLKRAQYFLTCGGKYLEGLRVSPDGVLRHLVAQERPMLTQGAPGSSPSSSRRVRRRPWTGHWFPYAYDGSFAGFLTCVFASYAHREEPMSFSTPEDGRISLWPERTVDTDEARAQRVYRSLAPRLGQEGRRLAVYGFLTCLEERELHLWRFLRLGYDRGPWVVRDPHRRPGGSADLRGGPPDRRGPSAQGLHTLLRAGGVLVGEIAPKNRVLPPPAPLLRLLSGGVLLSSTTAPPGGAVLPAPAVGHRSPGGVPAPQPPPRTSAACGGGFYDTIAIEGRENPGAA